MSGADPITPGTPAVVAVRYLVRGLPDEHSGQSYADVAMTKTLDGWKVGDAGGWFGPGGAESAVAVEMDYATAVEAASIEAARLACAVLAVHPR